MKRTLQDPQNFESPPLTSAHQPKVWLKKKPTEFFPPRFFNEEEKDRIVIEGQSGNLSVEELCAREQITPDQFFQWSEEFLNESAATYLSSNHIDDNKFRIVLDGLNGSYSIQELCNREHITQEQFLLWSHDFLRLISLKSKKEDDRRNLTYQKRSLIRQRVGAEGLWYFESYLNLSNTNSKVFENCADFELAHNLNFEHVICLKKINDIRYINKFFEQLNERMEVGSIFIGCMETFFARKDRIWVNKIPVLNTVYFGLEFIIKRILPKLSLAKKMYFDITKGKDRLLSKAEGLGRLVCCGFKIMDYRTINGLVYFVVQKEKEPAYDLNPSYGPIYAMPRLGKNGKIIRVYKFRTMHPYSEYLQDYVLKTNGYAETGKPANDFRIPAWAKVMRKYWLDELPQLINLFKGDLKLIGIRPVSERYFKDIPKEMQKLRLTQKPGCIPPYVSLNRSGNVMSVLQAEKEYLEEKIKNPYTTDTKYFFKALFNIIVRHKRSA